MGWPTTAWCAVCRQRYNSCDSAERAFFTNQDRLLVKLYHMTPASTLDAVLREGLDPARSASSLPAVFLAGSAATAANYEGMKDEPCVVVEVDLPEEFFVHLGPDNYELRDLLSDMSAAQRRQHGVERDGEWHHCSWRQSLAICDQLACTAKIPPGYITPLRPEFVLPSQNQIVEVLKQHPLLALRETVQRAYVVGSFAKEALGLGVTHASSDVDVLLEVRKRTDETDRELETRYRQKLMAHFVRHQIQGRDDSVHPQWCGRRVDVYFTYDAELEARTKLALEAPRPRPRLKSP